MLLTYGGSPDTYYKACCKAFAVNRSHNKIKLKSEERNIMILNLYEREFSFQLSEPRSDTCDLCATLILDILEVTGNVLWTAYPKQFHKLLMLLKEQYFPRVQNVAGGGGGPLVRLDDFLNSALACGVIRPPDGLLPRNFW